MDFNSGINMAAPVVAEPKKIEDEVRDILAQLKEVISEKDEVISAKDARIENLEFSLKQIKEDLVSLVGGALKASEDVHRNN